MSSTTAIAAIGDDDPNDGGISVSYLLHLTENSRAILQLFRLQTNPQELRVELLARWTPTLENMLEDLLLLIGTAVCGDLILRAELLSHIGADDLTRLHLDSLPDEHRREIYRRLQSEVPGSVRDAKQPALLSSVRCQGASESEPQDHTTDP